MKNIRHLMALHMSGRNQEAFITALDLLQRTRNERQFGALMGIVQVAVTELGVAEIKRYLSVWTMLREEGKIPEHLAVPPELVAVGLAECIPRYPGYKRKLLWIDGFVGSGSLGHAFWNSRRNRLRKTCELLRATRSPRLSRSELSASLSPLDVLYRKLSRGT